MQLCIIIKMKYICTYAKRANIRKRKAAIGDFACISRLYFSLAIKVGGNSKDVRTFRSRAIVRA